MKAVVAAFNQEKALVGAFSVITNLRMQLFGALVAPQEDEIARIVRDHDVVYFSVNFGEVLIKEMLMCSMFGVQVRESL